MGHDDTSCRSEFDIHKQLQELLSEPVDYSAAIDAIAGLVRQGKTTEALQKLETFKQEINSSVATLFLLLAGDNEKIHKQEMEIKELRIQVIEGAIRYAELNNDSEGVTIGQELLSKETALVSSSIAYLDSEG